MSFPIWLAGSLAGHARGRRLADLVGSRKVEGPEPESGMCLFFGNEFQKLNKDDQTGWLHWSQEPGRIFLVVPPLAVGKLTELLDWEFLGLGSIQDSLSSNLARRLAAEVRIQIKGTFQVPSRPNGTWDNGTVNTCFFRKHPHAGVFAATCLPVWSLGLLDSKAELLDWFAQLHELAGKPSAKDKEKEAGTFQATPEHFTLLLHLSSAQFGSEGDALEELLRSPYFQMTIGAAQRCMKDLAAQGLARGGRLTTAGRSLLADSAYAPFAEELERKLA